MREADGPLRPHSSRLAHVAELQSRDAQFGRCLKLRFHLCRAQSARTRGKQNHLRAGIVNDPCDTGSTHFRRFVVDAESFFARRHERDILAEDDTFLWLVPRKVHAYTGAVREPFHRHSFDSLCRPIESDAAKLPRKSGIHRSEEHTSELQSHSFISYAVFCLKKKK